MAHRLAHRPGRVAEAMAGALAALAMACSDEGNTGAVSGPVRDATADASSAVGSGGEPTPGSGGAAVTGGSGGTAGGSGGGLPSATGGGRADMYSCGQKPSVGACEDCLTQWCCDRGFLSATWDPWGYRGFLYFATTLACTRECFDTRSGVPTAPDARVPTATERLEACIDDCTTRFDDAVPDRFHQLMACITRSECGRSSEWNAGLNPADCARDPACSAMYLVDGATLPPVSVDCSSDPICSKYLVDGASVLPTEPPAEPPCAALCFRSWPADGGDRPLLECSPEPVTGYPIVLRRDH